MKNPDNGRAATEEMFALVGKAITRWSFVEESLGFIFLVCASPVACGRKGGLDMAHSNVASCAYHSVENFRSKLRLVDAAVTASLNLPGGAGDILQEWRKLHDKTRKLSLKRNRLAHHTLLPGYDLDDRTIEPRLVPPIGSPAFYKETGFAGGKQTRRLEHVKHLIRAFILLEEKLHDFAERLAQHEALFDKYVEQLVGQIRSHSQSDPKRAEQIKRALSSLR